MRELFRGLAGAALAGALSLGGLCGPLQAQTAPSPQAAPPPGIAKYLGRAPQMERLLVLEGAWKFEQAIYRPKKQIWEKGPEFYGVFSRRYGGHYLESEQIIPLGDGTAYMNNLILSYDKFRKVYRMTLQENLVGLLDVFEGDFQGDTLIMDDLKSGTAPPNMNGKLEFTRISIALPAQGPALIVFAAKRKGEWVDGFRITLTKAGM
jgi:hypothetical protein